MSTDPEHYIPGWVGPEARLILSSLYRLEAAMAVTQQQLDQYAAAVGAFSAQVNTAVDGLRTDIQALKDANPNLDASALDARLGELDAATGRLNALDAENPPAEPPPPPPPTP